MCLRISDSTWNQQILPFLEISKKRPFWTSPWKFDHTKHNFILKLWYNTAQTPENIFLGLWNVKTS